jgi:hypothetical protein
VATIGSGSGLLFAIAPAHYVLVLLPFALLFVVSFGFFLMNLSFDSTPPSRIYEGAPRLAR